eukprot:9237248-Alexandrium_andersonii.AAC.1
MQGLRQRFPHQADGAPTTLRDRVAVAHLTVSTKVVNEPCEVPLFDGAVHDANRVRRRHPLEEQPLGDRGGVVTPHRRHVAELSAGRIRALSELVDNMPDGIQLLLTGSGSLGRIRA